MNPSRSGNLESNRFNYSAVKNSSTAFIPVVASTVSRKSFAECVELAAKNWRSGHGVRHQINRQNHSWDCPVEQVFRFPAEAETAAIAVCRPPASDHSLPRTPSRPRLRWPSLHSSPSAFGSETNFRFTAIGSSPIASCRHGCAWLDRCCFLFLKFGAAVVFLYLRSAASLSA